MAKGRLHDLILLVVACMAAAHLVWLGFFNSPGRKAVLAHQIDADARAQERASLAAQLGALPAPQAGPKVLLIAIEGLRADGLRASETPNLTALFRGGRSYANMWSVSPVDQDAMAALTTGRRPFDAGCYQATGPDGDALVEGPTLAGVLQEAGWRTVSIEGARGPWVTGCGLQQGFDVRVGPELDAQLEGLSTPQADRLVALAEQALAQEGAVFVQLHLVDPARQWTPREDFVRDPSRLIAQSLPGGATNSYRGRIRRVMKGVREPFPGELASWDEAWRSELRFVDDALGPLLDDSELHVVVVGTNGVFLGEHALVEAGRGLWEEGLRVPLILNGPGIDPGMEQSPVQTNDVPRLLLDWLQLDVTLGQASDGVQLSERWGPTNSELRSRFASAIKTPGYAVRDGSHKVMVVGEAVQAFDLEADPKEATPIEAEWAAALQAEAERRRSSAR